jgi:hypothetical protein
MALTKCNECGGQVSTEAIACPKCGAPLKKATSPQPNPGTQQQLGRIESIVVQVAPSYENDKIQEMQIFGWNLQGRQEIHEEGDAYGRPSYVSDSTYVVKTKVRHYVKLHFTRSLSLPNIDKVKQIEAEYFSLPFPGPASLVGPIVVMVFFGIGIFPAIGAMSQNMAEGFGLLVVYGVFVGLGYLWLQSRLKKRREAAATCGKSARRMKELRSALDALAC